MSRFAQKQTGDVDQVLKDEHYQHGFAFSTDQYSHILKPGLTEGVVREISAIKGEPEWMLKLRLEALQQFEAKPTPLWGGDLTAIDYHKIRYYLRPTDRQEKQWADVPKEIQETFDRIGVPEAEKKYLAGVKMQYDCLTADARVFMNNGVKKIVDVKPGEYVYSLNEETNLLEEQKVLGIANKGDRKIFKVVTQGGREIKVTANHPFLHLAYERKAGKVRGRYHKEWKYLSDLKIGDLIALTVDIPDYGQSCLLPEIQKPNTKISSHNQFGEYELDVSNWYAKITFPKQTDEDLMWLLGLYIGDGFLSSKNGNGQRTGVDLAIPDFEGELRNEIARVVKKQFNYDLLVKQKFKVTLNSILFAHFFEELGFFGGAHTKRIPEWVFSLPRSQKLAFIGGYFDADGNIRKDYRQLVMTSVSKELLEDLQMLLLSCGLHTSHVWKFESNYTYKGETRKNYGYRLNITGDLNKVDSRMIKKRERFRESKFTRSFNTAKGTVFRKHASDHIGFVKILSIEEVGVEPVYDIEVEGFHNFVANGLIVHNSEVVYGSLKNIWAKDGVIFLSMDEGLAKYPELVKEYFGKLIPSGDNKFSALNTAVWSGGSFVYVPKGVEVKMPLQTYFRINAPNAGQFERTLIIVDEGAKVHYQEGCTAPVFSDSSLHSAVVEIYVKKGARCQYTTIQNWYKNVYNLVTKRARVEEEGEMIWTDFNMGSKLTMKYPGFVLAGKGARGEALSMALAGSEQHQDTGSKAIHLAPYTSSTIISKSISKNGGRTSYRGLVHITPQAHHSKNTVICDALLLDSQSRSDTYPTDRILNSTAEVQHEATVSKIGEEQLFYLMSRGITEENARKMIVNGFIDGLVKKLPLEYAVEMNRLIDHEMEGSIG